MAQAPTENKMTFDEWYEREGRAMAEGGCSQEIVARAAFFVATNNEREACAKLCEETASEPSEGRSLAEDIRARSNAKLTGDPQLHRGASSEQSERG
jgi:hypothetical protein